MGVEPELDGVEVGGQGAGVAEGARGMAHVEIGGGLIAGPVHLGLEEADAGVEVGYYIDVLVVGGVQAGEGRVVGADVGYVGV